jgi:quercetin dioxygenase-like cupin family protein
MKCLLILTIMFTSSFALADSHQALKINPTDKNLAWGPCPPIFPKTCSLAVLHGDPAKPNADLLLKATKGTKFAPHVHASPERMILVEGEMEVHYQGHKKQTLKKGEYAYGPAMLPHEASCIKGPCYLFIAFEGPVNAEAFEGEIK